MPAPLPFRVEITSLRYDSCTGRERKWIIEELPLIKTVISRRCLPETMVVAVVAKDIWKRKVVNTGPCIGPALVTFQLLCRVCCIFNCVSDKYMSGRCYRVHRKIFRGPSTLFVLLYTPVIIITGTPKPNLSAGLRRIAR